MSQTQKRFTPNIKLKEFNIGQVSGENEAQNEKFDELFYTGNQKYEELKNPEKYIIMGRKGTGKTLLSYYFKKKSEEDNLNVCKITTLKDYQLAKIIHLEDRDFFDEECKILWKYCILRELGKIILSNEKYIKKLIFPNLKKLDKLISKDSFKLAEVNKTTGNIKKKNSNAKINRANKKLEISLNHALDVGLYNEKNASMSEKYIPNEYYNNIEIMENLIFKILSKQKKGYIIIFDDLDELGDNVKNVEKYRLSILSMITVIKEFNVDLNRVNKDSRIIVSIRSDILNNLNEYSSNLRKIIADNAVDLYWLNKSHSKVTDYLLIDLILTKIKASVKEYKDIDKEILFKSLFPKDINGKKMSDFLLDYSMGRPRQIIEYLNMIIKHYPNETKFKHKHFKDCFKLFSVELYRELQNEFSIYENKDELNDSIKLIEDLCKASFKYGELVAHYNVNKNRYKHIKSIDDTLNYMYSFGVVGTYSPNQMYSWGYRNDSNENIKKDNNEVIIVNDALKHKFNIK